VAEASVCVAAAVRARKQMRWRRGRQTWRGGCRCDRRGAGATAVHAGSDGDGVQTRGRRALRPVGRDTRERERGVEAGQAGSVSWAEREAAAR